MRVLLVRHAEDDGRYRGGWSSRDITPQGAAQARELARKLGQSRWKQEITRLVASDLQRTLTTAGILSQALGLPVERESRLRETNNGDLAGMLNEEALRKYPGLFFSSLGMDEEYPNGESPRAFYNRVKAWLERFLEEEQGAAGGVLVVTHGGVINVIYHIVRGLDWSNRGPAFKVGNCSVHVLDTDDMTIEELPV